MWEQAFVVLLTVAGVAVGIPDPCDPGSHVELDERRRSTGFVTEYPETPLCDINLQSGWYRFTSAAGGMIPEQCPDKMRCGTIVPVWLNGSHPTQSEGMVSRSACANFDTEDTENAHHCCEHSLRIGVKNCGSYYVYYLKATPSCPIAYCAGDRAPCPVGKYSPTGFPPDCKDAYPMMTSDPVLSGPTMDSNTSFYFACTVNFAAQDPDQAFEVVWTFDGQEDPNIPHVMVRDPQRTVRLPGTALQGHMGTNVGCKVRSRYMSHANQTSPYLPSNTYWAGIRTDPAHVTITEKQEEQNVTLTSTIPIVCEHTLECCLTLKVDVDGPRENVVSSHACEYYMCTEDWDPVRGEASLDIPLVAAQDQITDGDKDVLLTFEKILTAGGGPYLQTFDNYRPDSVPVDVVDVGSKTCVWTGDPHIHGMNHQGTYHLFRVGDYTMFESTRRDMEIQARTWPCNRGRATCICGVAIRERDDVIRINQCDQPYNGHHTSPTVEVATDLREGTTIHRSTDGKHILVYLPSGTEVKIDATPMYLNAYLTVPSIDEGEARGVCGTFDGVNNNEFMKRDGETVTECSRSDRRCVPSTFTESWNNDKQTSLFETLPPRTNPYYEPAYCNCDKDERGEARVNCSAAGDITKHNLKCSGCRAVTGPLPSFMDPSQTWNRRSQQYVDLDERDPKFDIDLHRNFTVPAASWPTPSGITEQQAEAACRQALQNTQLWSHCGHLTTLSDINVIDCVTDILYGDSLDFILSSQAAFLTECQSTLSRDPSNYVSDASGKTVLKPELNEDVCSAFCQQHGRCERGTCVCEAGYQGDNCQLLAGKGPQLAKIRSNRACDLSRRPCRKIFIDASNLEHVDTLACRAKEVQADGSLSTTQHVEEGQFLSAGRLACPLPDTRGKAVTTLSVAATNDGQLYGNELLVTVYDSTCQTCDDRGACSQKANTCLIDDRCYQDGDVNPSDSSKVCDVSANVHQWTSKANDQYPALESVELAGPTDDFLMTCRGVASSYMSATPSPSARFQVTWYVDGHETTTEVVTGDTMAYLALSDLPKSGQLTCGVKSFFAGHTDFSAMVTSATSIQLDAVAREPSA